MLGYSVVNQKGQVTIPANIRRSLDINPQEKVSLSRVSEGVLIKSIKSVSDLRGSVKPKSKPEDFKKMRKTFINYLASKK